jgi:hypothetical protein
MWTSDGRVDNEKFFNGSDLLVARREAFHYAGNLAHIMEEARKAGVISYSTPEEILDPVNEFEEVVIGNVFVSVVYEEKQGSGVQSDEDIIHMIFSEEENIEGLPEDEEKLVLQKMEVFDTNDPEIIRIRNREAWYYIREGGFKAIRIVPSAIQPLFLLLDDYLRLKGKQLI